MLDTIETSKVYRASDSGCQDSFLYIAKTHSCAMTMKMVQ